MGSGTVRTARLAVSTRAGALGPASTSLNLLPLKPCPHTSLLLSKLPR
jgi:hypothetical protein